MYETLQGPLRRYVSSTLGRPDLANDIVQEGFLRALSADRLPADPVEARPYMFRIITNLVRDDWRRVQRSRGVEPVVEADLPDATAVQIDVARAFEKLSLRERQIVWLAHVERLDHVAIADSLRVKSSSVKVLLHRARRKLGALLHEGGYR